MTTEDSAHPALSISYGLPAGMGINYFGEDPFPIDSALAARPILNITIGPGSRNRRNQPEELAALIKNNVALVPNVAVVVFTIHPAV